MHYHKCGHHVHILCYSDHQNLVINYGYVLPKTTVFPFQWHKNKYRNQDSKYVCVFVVCLVVVYHHGYNEIVKRECMICFSTHHIIAWFCRTSVLQFDQIPAINAQDRGSGEPHWGPLFGPKTQFKESRVLTHSTHRRTICFVNIRHGSQDLLRCPFTSVLKNTAMIFMHIN